MRGGKNGKKSTRSGQKTSSEADIVGGKSTPVCEGDDMVDYSYRTEHIGMREFPPFIRVTLNGDARKELFSRAMKRVGTIERKYETSDDIFDVLYGEKKGVILRFLSKGPQTARTLMEVSGLSHSIVYHFLNFLKERHIVSKKGCMYYLEEHDFHSFSLEEIVKLEENPLSRRKYGFSIKELELAYFLWDACMKITSREKGYARHYNNMYTLADAVHRWRTGRTDVPVWALNGLVQLSGSDILQKWGSVAQYHLPPGTPVSPSYYDEYKLPVRVDGDLDKIVIQLLQKMSKNNMYMFPKRKKWLFKRLHTLFGGFDDSNSRIPLAITEIIKFHYRIKTLDRYSACIPPRIKARWSELNSLLRINEESSLLLHVISLSSRSNGGFEITSRSRLFLQDISTFLSDLGLGKLSLGTKHGRPHFRVYLSEGKVAVLKRYTHLFEEYPDLETWMRIPLNQIAEEVILTGVDFESVERICREELSRFVESILRSLEKKRVSRKDYLQYKEEVTYYFWERKMIPSLRRVEELTEMQIAEEENLLYA